MKKLIPLLLTFLCAVASLAQTGSIQGKIVGSDQKPLAMATLTVFLAKDTSIVSYRISNESGEFKFSNLPINVPLRLLATYVGNEAYRQSFTLTSQNPSVKLDVIKMQMTSKSLDEVIVTAERPPITVKNDTIEFNANSFKTLPNALVEDLLKKLPGVRVDADGNITMNGKPVNKILVDGKSFFGDDPKMATRNLPANAIDKIQAVDDKEQALLNGDNNTSNVGKVINITLKKGYKKSAFGKVYAGGGTQDVYELGGIMNIFRDTLQVSVLGYSNNLNRPGFSYSELMNNGGLRRSNSNRTSSSTRINNGMNGSMVDINGVNFGGNTNFGIATSNGGGFNINHAPSNKKSFYLQYYFGEVRNRLSTDRLAELYNGDTIISNHRQTNVLTKNYGHSVGGGFKIKTDSVTTLNFNAGYTSGLVREAPNVLISSENNYLGSQSMGAINQSNATNNVNYNHTFYLLRTGKTNSKRLMSIVQSLNLGNNTSDNMTNSTLNYYYPSRYDSLQNQLRQVRVPQTFGSFSISFYEPIHKYFTLRFTNRYSFTQVKNTTNLWYSSPLGDSYSVLNPLLSGTFERQQHEVFFAQKLAFQYKKLTLIAGIDETLLRSKLHTSAETEGIERNIQKLNPNLNITFDNLTLTYNKSYNLPSYSYLLPVFDNSNPYHVAKGNPRLLPTSTAEWMLSYNYNNQTKNINIWWYSSFQQRDNDIIQNITIDKQGIQTSSPVNADGTRNLYMNLNINKDFKLGEKNKLTLSAGGYYSINRSKMIFNADTSWQTTNQLSNWYGINFYYKDKIEWNNSYSPDFNFTSYSSPNFTGLKATLHNFNTNLIIRWTKNLILENNVIYLYNSNLTGANKTTVRWNAAINYNFMKDQRATIKLSAYDILNQNSNIVRLIASQNTLTYNRGNLLPRYFMITLTYNIKQMPRK
ncbi:outer membrane beta-barrel protein [Flectobacillus sp. BAB-3569]|uniref:outer membrane beta-barrel protein n=1 Tax=Flectobacillus sp. BAB-3569 TaxID=1509483 RepID=UPI000BA3A20C|nr:outer membrane beta-barrel protein [Flectobacillus sp. BAB-3569]PAC28755.1 hypothetical protein BWI92_19490 [Flectobacillus sp. BAB-3569]